MNNKSVFYVISYITPEFLSEEWHKDKRLPVPENVRVYKRDMTKLNRYKHANETLNVMEAQRYYTEKDANLAVERMMKFTYKHDVKIERVTVNYDFTVEPI